MSWEHTRVPPQGPYRWSTALCRSCPPITGGVRHSNGSLWDGDFLSRGRITGFWEVLPKRPADKAQPEVQLADLTPPGWVNSPGEVLGHKEEGAGLTHTADSVLISRHSQTLNKCVWECRVSAHQALLTSHRAERRGQSCPLSLRGSRCLENGADSPGGCQAACHKGTSSQQVRRTWSAVLSQQHRSRLWSIPAGAVSPSPGMWPRVQKAAGMSRQEQEIFHGEKARAQSVPCPSSKGVPASAGIERLLQEKVSNCNFSCGVGHDMDTSSLQRAPLGRGGMAEHLRQNQSKASVC